MTTIQFQGITVHAPEGVDVTFDGKNLTVGETVIEGIASLSNGTVTPKSRKVGRPSVPADTEQAIIDDLVKTEGYMPYSVLAKRHKVSQQTVSRIARKINVYRKSTERARPGGRGKQKPGPKPGKPGRKIPVAKRNDILAMRAAEITYDDIQVALGVPPSTIAKIVQGWATKAVRAVHGKSFSRALIAKCRDLHNKGQKYDTIAANVGRTPLAVRTMVESEAIYHHYNQTPTIARIPRV